MEWEKAFDPAYTVIKAKLKPGETMVIESGAMILTKGGVKVKTKAKGGILKSLGRSLLGGESFFMNEYYAEGEEGEVWFCPSLPGDIKYIKLENSEFHVQDTGYLAHHGDVEVGVKFKGFKGLFGGGNVVWLKIAGTGGVWIAGYGGIDEINLEPGEKIIIDNFHAIAIESTVKWNIKKFGGLKTFMFGGEGLVIEAEGPGRIYVQTRTLPSFIEILKKYLPK